MHPTLFSCFIYTSEKAFRSKLCLPPSISLPVYLCVYGVPITTLSGHSDSPIRSNSLPERRRNTTPPPAPCRRLLLGSTWRAPGELPASSLLSSNSRRGTFLAKKWIPPWNWAGRACRLIGRSIGGWVSICWAFKIWNDFNFIALQISNWAHFSQMWLCMLALSAVSIRRFQMLTLPFSPWSEEGCQTHRVPSRSLCWAYTAAMRPGHGGALWPSWLATALDPLPAVPALPSSLCFLPSGLPLSLLPGPASQKIGTAMTLLLQSWDSVSSHCGPFWPHTQSTQDSESPTVGISP